MTNDEKRHLLDLARKSILHYLEHRMPMNPPPPDFPELRENRAAFVTLTRHHQLRGCIGHMVAREPLYLAVAEMAISAAVEDHRFSPVTKREMGEIEIEISVLSPMQPIDDWRAIRLGTDGVLVQHGYHSGVFLPQVADETAWDLKTFLENLCQHKAGLPKDAYKDPSVRLHIFQVEKFRENEQPSPEQ